MRATKLGKQPLGRPDQRPVCWISSTPSACTRSRIWRHISCCQKGERLNVFIDAGVSLVCTHAVIIPRIQVLQLGSQNGLIGNCVESSNENPGLRAIASNIQRKCFVVNVRRHFHAPTHLYRTYYFSSKRCKIDFHLMLSIFHAGSRMSHHGLSLIEP